MYLQSADMGFLPAVPCLLTFTEQHTLQSIPVRQSDSYKNDMKFGEKIIGTIIGLMNKELVPIVN